jgi:hypothetical protein
MADLSPFRLALCLLPATGTRCWALEHHAGRGLDQRSPLRRPDAGTGDHIHHGNGCPDADRSTRTRTQQWRTSARHECPSPPRTPVACTSGSVEVNICYAPRPEYGLVVPLLAHVDGGVTARGGAEWLVLTAPLDLQLDRGTAHGQLTLNAGQTIHLALHRSTLEQPRHTSGQSLSLQQR